MPVEHFCPGDFDIELSEDGTIWASIRGYTRHVNPGERTRPVITYNTPDGPISCSGPPEPTEIELDFLYQEADTAAYAILRDAHYNNTPVWARWKPTSGTKEFTAVAATVPTWDEPDFDADASDMVNVLATLSADTITWTTVVP